MNFKELSEKIEDINESIDLIKIYVDFLRGFTLIWNGIMWIYMNLRSFTLIFIDLH